MFAVLAIIVPLGLASAVSPVMLAEQTVLLAGADGRTVATRYATGVVAVAVVYIGALVVWGRAIALPARPRLDSTMDLVLGLGLVGLATLLWVRRQDVGDRSTSTQGPPSHKEVGASGAFGFGIVSMVTNFTTLALLVPAAKAIAASPVELVGRMLLVAVLVVLATVPAWLPVALIGVAPGTAAKGLDALGRLLSRHGRAIVVVVVAALGAILIVRGVLRLADL